MAGELIGLAMTGEGAAAVVAPGATGRVVDIREVARIEAEESPRWIWWDKSTARQLVEANIRPGRCWDLAATHRLIFGGWRSGPEQIWALLHELDVTTIPTRVPVDLFSQAIDSGDPGDPVGPDGHLRPEWVEGEWNTTADRTLRWAELVVLVQQLQVPLIHSETTVFSESACELLCAEMEVDGLPFELSVGESIVAGFVGPRPATAGAASTELARRDAEVLQHLPTGSTFDLRSPDQVKSLLRRVGIEVPDTRAWRLETLRDAHPIVEPLMAWRRAERILTTFGFQWIDDNITVNHSGQSRLHGSWSGSDGAAGRMTATVGLHNMPAELRPAVAAEPGHVFVRADLGQIEPRILAAVAGDPKLAAATQEDDMYAPVAAQLRVERDIAKVAVLGAMYGQTTGKGAEALRSLEREYPIAMGFLATADRSAQGSKDLRTYGGRLVQMSSTNTNEFSERDARSQAAARGRYGRNAMIQGAAAEFFKTWAVLLRARGRMLDARIVLCLHDEVLIHVPEQNGPDAAALLDRCLQEAAYRWAPRDHAGNQPVRFVSDTSIIARWSEAK